MTRILIGMLAAALLAGCVVVPAEPHYRDDPSWYRHHRHDWDDRYDRYHRYDYRDDRVLP
ncbi:MAG TPA: hypothetical protein VJ673_03545 [Aromatoleum sp.]|uniref:hypothetical protein n=1 Tax=Aromatoleum sp. TaxID=2307007 RepID=UPI002B4A9AFA|nr:hypothetical protein [Aromatoleum sp.]HJV24731.1 hypothetical protein [Aromatoleum sp.]